jgi:hypothetical protein
MSRQCLCLFRARPGLEQKGHVGHSAGMEINFSFRALFGDLSGVQIFIKLPRGVAWDIEQWILWDLRCFILMS